MHIFIESCKNLSKFSRKCDIGCDFKTTILTFSNKNQIFKTNFIHNFLLKCTPKRTKLLYTSCLYIGKMP